jgi:hypothetical protein
MVRRPEFRLAKSERAAPGGAKAKGPATPPPFIAALFALDRSLPPAYYPSMRKPSPFSSVSAVLATVAKRLGLETKLLEFQLRRDWPRIVGQPIAAHTRPDQIRFKKLYLLVENSVWMQQLTFLKPALLAKINEAAGTELVTEIVLRIAELGSATSKESALNDDEGPPPEPTAEALAAAASHAESIRDPELRTHLTKVMAVAIARESRIGAGMQAPATEPPDRQQSS